MKEVKRRMIGILLTMVVTVALVMNGGLIYGDSPVIDPEEAVSLTIHKYIDKGGNTYTGNGMEEHPTNTIPISGAKYKLVKIADLANGVSSTLDGSNRIYSIGIYYKNLDPNFITLCSQTVGSISATKINNVDYYSSSTIQTAFSNIANITGDTPGLARINQFIAEHDNAIETAGTDSSGTTTWSGSKQDQGLYLVAESNQGNTASIGEGLQVTSPVRPFLVSLPMSTGSDGQNNKWLYSVNVYPKTPFVTVPKFIVSDASGGSLTTSEDFEIGETINQIIAPSVQPTPDDGDNYDSFTIADTMDEGLTFKGITKVVYGNQIDKPDLSTDFNGFQPLVLDEDYELLAGETGDEKVSNSNINTLRTFRIRLLGSGLTKINQFTQTGQVAVFFQAVMNKNAKAGEAKANQNTPSLILKQANTTEQTLSGNKVSVYTYRLNIKKEGLSNPENAAFSIKRGSTILKYKKNADGDYSISDGVGTGEEVTSASPDSSGNLIIRGLDDGTYTFTETATQNGYELLQTTFDVVLSPKSPVNGELNGATLSSNGTSTDITPTKGTVSIVVQNRSAIALRTGGSGLTMVYIGAAILLLLACVIGLMEFGRRRK